MAEIIGRLIPYVFIFGVLAVLTWFLWSSLKKPNWSIWKVGFFTTLLYAIWHSIFLSFIFSMEELAFSIIFGVCIPFVFPGFIILAGIAWIVRKLANVKKPEVVNTPIPTLEEPK